MFHSVLFSSAIVLAVLAPFASTQSSDPLIPTGISSSCATFLQSLDTDNSLSSCLGALATAVNAYGPGGDGTAATLSSTLNTLCPNPAMCSANSLSTQLANFQSACPNELQTSPNSQVVELYDTIYFLAPFKTAVCSKDDSGKYCVAQPASTGGNSVDMVNLSEAKYLYEAVTLTRRAATDPIYTLNTTTWTDNNVLFLGLNPSMSSADLCVSCTRNIMTPYINQESNVPYSPGLGSSAIASGQTALYNAIQQTCGGSFLSGAVQAAGGIAGNGPLSSLAASRSGSRDWKVMLTSAFLGLVTLI